LARAKKEPKNKDWVELCEYVKKEILQYDDNMKIPTYLVLKLQGLKKGQHIANNNIKITTKYTFVLDIKLSKMFLLLFCIQFSFSHLFYCEIGDLSSYSQFSN